MIRIKPSLPKSNKRDSTKRKINQVDEQNIKPIVFNTKGYFDPAVPYDEQYLKAKQKVFEKYRNKKEQYVMLDINNINKGAFVQRGLFVRSKINNQNSEDQRSFGTQKLSSNLLKNYLMRKQKREMIDHQKFVETSKVISDQLSVLSFRNSTLTSRTHSRHMSSRISTNSVLKLQTDF